MLATKKYIQNLREKSFVNISQEAEKLIIKKFENEPENDENGNIHIYTEQDIWEQTRKIIRNQQYR